MERRKTLTSRNAAKLLFEYTLMLCHPSKHTNIVPPLRTLQLHVNHHLYKISSCRKLPPHPRVGQTTPGSTRGSLHKCLSHSLHTSLIDQVGLHRRRLHTSAGRKHFVFKYINVIISQTYKYCLALPCQNCR
jgi:hypothetical protein